MSRLLLFNLATDADDPVLGFTTRWICALGKHVEFIHIITMRAGRVQLPDNVQLYSVGKERGYSEPRRALEFYRHLFRILCKDHIDICFSHMIPVFTVLAAPALKLKHIPILTWYAHPSLTWTLRLAHRLSNRIVASLDTAYPYRHDKLTVVGQGIDTDLFFPNGTSPEKPPVILCVGRLSSVKDHPTLLEAAAKLRKRWKHPFRLVILGGPVTPWDKPYAQSLYEQVETLDLQDIVSFEPPTPMSELPSWYRRCTVHVNLTPTGSGDKVALEAMSCARICLVTNEGFRATLGDHADKLLFQFGNADELSERLEWVLSRSKVERDAIGLYLRQQVMGAHSLDHLVKKLVDIFTLLSKTFKKEGEV
jgi:glycosyltransferase involved in cell wall biosynthesis